MTRMTTNRAFSLTCPTAVQFYCNERKCLHNKRDQQPHDWPGTPTWPPSHLLGCSDVILKALYTYIQLVMPLREEWKSSEIRVNPQAVAVVEVWRVFKTELFIILLRAVWVHIVLKRSSFNEIKKNK